MPLGSLRRRAALLCLLGGAGAAAALACNEPSDACADLAESDLIVVVYINDDGKRARTEIEVRRGDPDSLALALCKDSALYVDGQQAKRIRRPSGAHVYRVDAAPITGESAKYTLQLRDDGYRAEYLVNVTAPSFEITSPAKGVQLSRAATWDIAWTPARPGETIRVRVDDVVDGESCLGAPIELELPDEGAARINPGQLKVDAAGLPSVDVCDATLRLSRTAATALMPVGGGASGLHPDSRVLAATSRELEFSSVP
jgi:hypothetical protein